ncbi:Procollagen-lysine,2-oxoglutarate 5-dioxygenase [Trichinella patagoniensis]|uniref:procollagen-lysine 5-dioxygenase n=1 Tax=Trichinella patagoniensis TaxID=990121 RepID=A0A0V1A8Q3_9BILA|nr:Procollagen-lysine,2-oxoglutarate 5-dioxygenase [Trichinella patagoniensis]
MLLFVSLISVFQALASYSIQLAHPMLMKFVPLCSSILAVRVLVWYVISQAVKHFIFRSCSFWIRFPQGGKTVLVTGASAGIGAATAEDLCARGGKVIWGARDVRKAQKKLDDIAWTIHHGPRGYVLKIDLSSKKMIEDFVDEFKKREKRLDCLILNAAYWGPKRTTVDGFEETVGVNHLGHMYLVYLLMDLLKKSTPSRIIVLGSDIHRLCKGVQFDDFMSDNGYKQYKSYAHSKLCNMLFARELAHRLKGTGVTVHIVHPGTPVPSELMRHNWLSMVVFHTFIIRPLQHLFCRTVYQGSQTTVEYPVVKSGKRYLNSGAFIGYAPDIYKIITERSLRDDDDDQLYYTHIFLDPALREKHKIKLDSTSAVFQNLHGAVDDVDLDFSPSGHRMRQVRLANLAYGTEPVIIHGNGKSKMHLNYLGNYIGNWWNPTDGCVACNDDLLELNSDNENDFPFVVLACFINSGTPFLDKYFESILRLDYPKSRIGIVIFNRVEPHAVKVEHFVNLMDGEYHFVQADSAISLTERNARDRAVDICLESGCDYLFVVDAEARIDFPGTLKTLIEKNKSLIAPMMIRGEELWSNFWGALNDDGFYARSDDYISIAKRERLGLWNIPHFSTAYLIRKDRLSLLLSAYSYNGKNDPDMSFTQFCREKGFFMYVDNTEKYGHIMVSDNYNPLNRFADFYNIFQNRREWEERYLDEKYWDTLNNDYEFELPCPDVYHFPLFSKQFCKEMIAVMENYGRWSSGSNLDSRLAGGYENVPTRDIHMNQVDFERHWLNILDEYIRPVQEKTFIGYYSKPPHAIMNFVVRYKPDEQPALRPHHDASTYTVDIALNKAGEDFEGGGVRYVRYNCSVTNSPVGWALMHPGRLTHMHEGLPTTRGVRYILQMSRVGRDGNYPFEARRTFRQIRRLIELAKEMESDGLERIDFLGNLLMQRQSVEEVDLDGSPLASLPEFQTTLMAEIDMEVTSVFANLMEMVIHCQSVCAELEKDLNTANWHSENQVEKSARLATPFWPAVDQLQMWASEIVVMYSADLHRRKSDLDVLFVDTLTPLTKVTQLKQNWKQPAWFEQKCNHIMACVHYLINAMIEDLDGPQEQLAHSDVITVEQEKLDTPDQQNFKCRFCGLVYNYLSTLKAHERVHDVEEPYVCAKCGLSFRFYSELQTHSEEHKGTYTYKCGCGRSFAKYTDLLYHKHDSDDEDEPTEETVLAEKKPAYQGKYYPDPRNAYYCQFCCRGYKTSHELKYHLYSHRGERAFTVGSSRYLMNRM